jgi:carbonic anhydrase
MGRLLWSLLWLSAIAPLAGCDKVRDLVCEPLNKAAGADKKKDKEKDDGGVAADDGKAGAEAAPVVEAEPEEHTPAPAVPDKKGHKKGDKREAHAPGAEALLTSSQRGFALPFAWEKSPDEPLAKARKFLREVADDNQVYMAKGVGFFKALADGETPRATVLSCGDSRVQAGAFDATPENDVFTIRNLGNQVENALGSIQYGVEELHTPVLFVLGHTGCNAVKAAMTDTRSMPDALKRELSGLHPAKAGPKPDDKKLLAAVIANVHDQVKEALREFGGRVNAGELTIVGGVYDLKNELGQGAGRLAVINVNGIQDQTRLKSFVEAIMSGPGSAQAAQKAAEEDPMTRLARALADPGPPDEEEE